MLKRRIVRVGAALAALGATLAIGFAGSSPANADPKQFQALAGVGSDTTQDVMNALAGFSAGQSYLPLQSSAATGQVQLISFDATGSNCIASKPTGINFDRPNGSGNGRAALSRAIDGAGWRSATPQCGGTIDVSGLIDFARSSSGPSGTGGPLVHIPFGRDGVSFAYFRAAGAPVTDLSQAQLNQIFSTGATTVGGVRILPCGIQTGSGTHSFWLGAIGVTSGQENTATAECNALLPAGRAQENSGADLLARGNAAQAANPGTQVIIGFSAGAFIAKSNGFAPGAPPAGVGIGSITGLGAPVSGSAPTLAPVATFYNSTTFGRTVYNVFPDHIIDGFGNAALKDLFVGSGSKLCGAASTINNFGFLVAPNCGVTTIRGALHNNP